MRGMVEALRAGCVAAGLLAAVLPRPAAAQPYAGSLYFPNNAGGLVSGTGAAVSLGTGLTLSGGTLTAAGGSGGSAVRAGQFELETPGSQPLTTSPYYLSVYLPLPGTVLDARAAGLSASGANLQYAVHLVHAGTDSVVTGLGAVAVCDGESTCAAGTTGTYAAPLLTSATGANTYVAGDQLYVSFSAVGGTFTNFTLHLDVSQ